MKILVVEDEKWLNEITTKRLKSDKYSVDNCFDGQTALDYIKSTSYDVILLDIMIPLIDGITLLKKIRSDKINTPVILLTAMDSIEDRVNGLNCGADDYVIKPFSFDELIARISAVTRREKENKTNIFSVADLEADFNKKIVKRGDKIIDLSSKEYAILELLIKNEGIILSRAQIERKVWDFDYEGASNMIDVYIRYLRKKIDVGFEPKLIHTKRNMGYYLKVKDE